MKKIFAHYDSEGIYVYQAFKPSIVKAALEKGTFGYGFNLDRMTWIKPSFGWMLYRSGYATRPRQEAILKIKLLHDGFLTILRQSIPTIFDDNIFPDEVTWKKALDKSDVRHQWDPERDLTGRKTGRRAIQIGIKRKTVQRYVGEWIIGLEEVTALAREIGTLRQAGKKITVQVPEETVYPVDESLQKRLSIDAD